ncbi:MAG: NAD(P)/FAD-dependent oxidoreductase [Candidatus Helarchaeota archaeon]
MNFDLIIAGADCGGSTVAKLVGNAGYSILLLDRKTENELGRPWFDAVYPDVFSLAGIEPFGICRDVTRTKIISPNEKISGVVESGGDYLIDRRKLSKKLIGPIKKMENIVFKDEIEVIRPILENNYVIGVEVKEDGVLKVYNGKITVDATGIDSVLRKQMPPETGIDSSELEDFELAITTKEIRKQKKKTTLNESYFGVYGGNAWVNNDRDCISEVGVRFRKDLSLDPHEIIEKMCSTRDYISDEIIASGTELTPMRRPFDQLVSNGFMLVGTSACQSDPASGMGVSAAIIAGNLAAKTIIKALSLGKSNIETLWEYQVEFVKTKGAEYAGLDVIRKWFQFVTEEEFDFLMENDILSFDIIEYLGGKKHSSADLSLKDLLVKFLKGFVKRPGLMNRIRKALSQSERMKSIYSKKFPEKYNKELFDKWKSKVNKFIIKVKDQSYKTKKENKED